MGRHNLFLVCSVPPLSLSLTHIHLMAGRELQSRAMQPSPAGPPSARPAHIKPTKKPKRKPINTESESTQTNMVARDKVSLDVNQHPTGIHPTSQKTATPPTAAPEPAHANAKMSEGEAEIHALETKLKQAQEAQHLRGALESSTVRNFTSNLIGNKADCSATARQVETSLHNDVFVPDINLQLSITNQVDDDEQTNSPPMKTSPALKRKAASEAVKNERSGPTPPHTLLLTCDIPGSSVQRMSIPLA